MNEKVITLSKVYNECKIFSSIIFILDKLEGDGYFDNIFESLQNIFEKEMAFAVLELKKIKMKKKKFDIHNQLINNTFIFKENLKLILASLIDSLWNHRVGPENISQTIQMAQGTNIKGGFEEIIEEEDENYISSEVPSKISVSDPTKNVIVKEPEFKSQSMNKNTGTGKESEGDFEYSYTTDKDSKNHKFISGDLLGKFKSINNENEPIKPKIKNNIKQSAFAEDKIYYATETLKSNKIEKNKEQVNLNKKIIQTNSESLNLKNKKEEIELFTKIISNEVSFEEDISFKKKKSKVINSQSEEIGSYKFVTENPKDLLSLTVSNISQNGIKTLNDSKKDKEKLEQQNNNINVFNRSDGLNKYLQKRSQDKIKPNIKKSSEKIIKTISYSKDSNSSMKYFHGPDFDNKSRSYDNSRFKNNDKKSLLRKLSEKKQKEIRKAKNFSQIHKSISSLTKEISNQKKSSLTKLKKLKNILINSERNPYKKLLNKYSNRECNSTVISPQINTMPLSKKFPTQIDSKYEENNRDNPRWKNKKDQSKSINIQININDVHNKPAPPFEDNIKTLNSKKRSLRLNPNTVSSSFSMSNTNSSWFIKDSSKSNHNLNNQIFSKKMPIFGIKRSKNIN